MPCISYTPKNFHPETLTLIMAANKIIDEYMADDLRLSLRQLYYQFVHRKLFPESYRMIFRNGRWIRHSAGTKNNPLSYKKMTTWISDGRLAGLIDWEAIEDRTRNLQSLAHWKHPSEIMTAAADQYRIDRWKDQTHRPEVWIEKDALAGVIEPVCQEFDVSYLACRGYMSQSEMWASAQRMLRRWNDRQQTPVIIHLGDHDPSGIDMTRDIQDRICVFGCDMVIMNRIALNLDQVEFYKLPPDPAKVTDSRCQGYIERFGDESWELDALDPKTLRDLIRKEMREWMEEDLYAAQVVREQQQREKLGKAAQKIDWEK